MLVNRKPTKPWIHALWTAALATTGAAGQGTAPTDGVQTLAPVNVSAKAPDDYAAKSADTGVLGDLPLLSTPFSVNVITHDLIVNQQATYLGEFLKNDPSAQIGNVVVSFATLRGFTLGSSGFLLDGLQLGSLLNDGRIGLQAFDRVDILKGASAFLYGPGSSSSLGGVLNYIPKQPGNTPERDVFLTYSSRSQFGVQADVGDRFGPDREFGLRFNGAYRDGDTAVDYTSWRQGVASLSADWGITRDLVVQGGLYYVDNDWTGIQPFFISASDASGPVPIPAAPGTRHNIGPSWNVFDQNSTLGWLRGDWAFAPSWTLTVQYGAGENNRPYGQTMDTRFGSITSASGDVLLFASEETYRVKAQAGQALVHGRFVTGPVQHDLTLGVSGSEEKDYSSFVIAGFVPGSLYARNDPPQPPLVPIDDLPPTGRTKTAGAFINDIVSFDEHWSVLLGGRQAKIDTYGPDGTALPGQSVSRFSPAAALMWKPTASSLVYANFAQGLEPGGTAPDGSANAGEIMPPLVTEQFEIGGKLETGGLTLTAAVFDMRRPLQYRDATNTWVQSGDQVHTGVEVLASGEITPSLRVVAGVMYLDAEQRNTGNPALDGKKVAGVPAWTANAWFDWRTGVVPGLFLNAGIYYADKQYFDAANLQSIPSWTRLDLGARYETAIGGKATTFYLVVENVADRSYWASALGNALTLGDPLTVKATARVSF
ncbi:MAG TPA: TonB-dependent siderophore receptor [Burkholderiales bacterium]|nr:TonB-dependent siderophore receptor [Burkholderiales bacterium]